MNSNLPFTQVMGTFSQPITQKVPILTVFEKKNLILTFL